MLEEIFNVISKYFQFTVFFCRASNAIQLRTCFVFSLSWILFQLILQVTFQNCCELVKRGHQIHEFFINKGNWEFEERASDFGLDIKGFSIHASFFDFDKDGDLDAYVMNHNVEDFKRFDVAAIHQKKDQYAGDQLFENQNGQFVDITDQAGVAAKEGFKTGVTMADVNNDGWLDIYGTA